MPDSGTLTHLKTPAETSDLRIDAGFRNGDTVSAHYDPMIAKLIVRGPNRAAALQRLLAALEQYEIAGPATNIEFLKRVTASSAFAAGGVETGFIEQHRAELFDRRDIPDDALAQAALGAVLLDSKQGPSASSGLPAGLSIGFETAVQERAIQLLEPAVPGQVDGETISHAVSVRQTAPDTFTIVTPGRTFEGVQATYDGGSKLLTSFYPHTRLSTTLIRNSTPSPTGPAESLTLFQHGSKYNLTIATPDWLASALGTKAQGESVKAPMPCKVLRVDVGEGDSVKKGQTLVVVESMKMEMVLASPVDGVVKRIVHGAGEICSAGTALVEFEEGDA
jgi:3-methylcrotonyl-CoA carboxylase alpha subunit